MVVMDNRHGRRRPASTGRYAPRTSPAAVPVAVPDEETAVDFIVADALRQLRYGPVNYDYVLHLATIVAWSEGHDDIEMVAFRELIGEAS